MNDTLTILDDLKSFRLTILNLNKAIAKRVPNKVKILNDREAAVNAYRTRLSDLCAIGLKFFEDDLKNQIDDEKKRNEEYMTNVNLFKKQG